MVNPSAIQQRARSDVKKYGHHVFKVLPAEGRPPFAYTVGMAQTYKKPELVIVGLFVETLHSLLNLAVTAIEKEKRIKTDMTLEHVVTGYPVKLMRVGPQAFDEYLIQSVEFYGKCMPTYQVLWPDKQGRFPDNEKFDRTLKKVQPLLR